MLLAAAGKPTEQVASDSAPPGEGAECVSGTVERTPLTAPPSPASALVLALRAGRATVLAASLLLGTSVAGAADDDDCSDDKLAACMVPPSAAL